MDAGWHEARHPFLFSEVKPIRIRPCLPKLLSASLLLAILASSSLACTTITSLIAGPAPAPTATPKPSPTLQPPPAGSLAPAERAKFFVILQSNNSDKW